MSNLGFHPRSRQKKDERNKTKSKNTQRPTPSALGTGMAARAGAAIQSRHKKLDELMGYADGGLIKGPSTGTSDDIEKQVPTGSYIMPADSTKQITPRALKNLGKPARVNLSNGEYELPPEQIYALGVQVLDQMKDSTHKPVGGFHIDEANRFVNGGVVGDEATRRRTQQQARPSPEERVRQRAESETRSESDR